jgi:hypothetical protein
VSDRETLLRFQQRADRRLGALGWHFNDCSEHVQIVRFCVRGAERTKTFVTAAAQAA